MSSTAITLQEANEQPLLLGNTSQVTSGYSCCNNLLVQVTPLNQPNYFLLMTYRASQAAINGLWPKQGMKESLKWTVWQQILQKSKVTDLAADQKPHVTATLNWRTYLSKVSLLPLASLNIWGSATTMKRKLFLQCQRSLIQYIWQNDPKQVIILSVERSYFSAVAGVLRHQPIKGGLSLKTRKLELNATQQYVETLGRKNVVLQFNRPWAEGDIRLDNDGQVQCIDLRSLWCLCR